MSFSGKLENVRLRDLLRLTASRRLSGRLAVRRRGEEGLILFRKGKIVAAVSSGDPPTLGCVLLSEGYIGERDLYKAIELQRQGDGAERLTRVLERMGAVSKADLERVIRRKMEHVLEGLLGWETGFFELVPAALAGGGEIEIDPLELLGPGNGPPPELDLGELEAWGFPAGDGEDPGDETQPAAQPPLEADALLAQVPMVTGEATLAILKAARAELGRGVLFAVRNGTFCPIASFGIEAAGGDPVRLRSLEIPEHAPSALRDAAEHGGIVRSDLEANEWNSALVGRLGGGWPREAVVGAVQAMGRTLVVLYGDHLPEARPVGAAPRLEAALAEVALKLERETAERRRLLSDAASSLAAAAPPEPAADERDVAALSRKLDRLLEQNETLIREFRAREQTLWHVAHHDPLTGLPNRFLFRELLAKELAHARQDSTLVAVAIFDIDHFKDLNDRFGEAFGDELLSEVGHRILRIIRAEDTLARLDSDEFALVVPKGKQIGNPMLVIRRLFDAFAQPFEVDKDEVRLSISMGVSFYPSDGRVPGELILNAETALKRAKETGRNKLEVFVPSMNEWAQVRMELAQELRHAVATGNDLSLLFQPIVAVDTGRLLGAEALVRWTPPDRDPVEPRVLIELAEDTGLMPPLGEWILRQACRCLVDWQDLAERVPLNVNVSVRQLQREGLVEAVVRALTETELPPELLQLEITESIAALNDPNIHGILERLDRLGIKVVLDDFGAGYSSLSYLMRYSVTGLKIDRSFVAMLPESIQARAVVEAAVGLGRNLGLTVVAEGVETVEHLEFLRRLKCPCAQGNSLSPALTPDRFGRLLASGALPRVADESS